MISLIRDDHFSEAEFRTMKYGPEYPDRFDGYDHARDFCRQFFPWYNDEHRHVLDQRECDIGLKVQWTRLMVKEVVGADHAATRS